MERDLGVVEDGGFNAIRTAHYPNHPRFLDVCDQRGLLVIEEIPLWQFDSERFARGNVLNQGRRMATEMIERDYHHPSVIVWSLYNDCATDEAGVYDATNWRDFLDELTATYADKPIVLSEFSAGAVAGERTFERQKWSEPYQAELLTDVVEALQGYEEVAGFAVWQCCDTRTDPAKFPRRPKTKNNKGIVDEYRRPKEAYWALRDVLSDD